MSELERDLAQDIAGSTMALAVRRMVLLLISGLSTMVIARFLEPSEYGQLQAALATWILFQAICDFGFSLVLGRDLAAYPHQRHSLLTTSSLVQAAWSLVLVAGLLVVSYLSGWSSTRGQLFLVLAPSLVAAAFTGSRTLFLVMFRAAATVKIDLVCNIVLVIIMVTAAAMGAGIVVIAAAISVNTMINAIWIAVAAKPLLTAPPPDLPVAAVRVTARQLVLAVLPLGIMGVMSKIYFSIDLVILGFLSKEDEVGEYATAVKLVGLVNTLPALLLASALPGLALVVQSKEDLRALLARLLHWVAAAILPIFLGLAIFAGLAVKVSVGDDYADAAGFVTILCVGGILGLVGQIIGQALVAARLVRPLLLQNVIAVIFNVTLNLLLVPRHGAIACAWLTVITEAIVLMGSLITLRAHLSLLVPLNDSLRPLLVAAMACSISLLALLVLPAFAALALGLLVIIAGTVALRSWPAELVPRRFRSAVA